MSDELFWPPLSGSGKDSTSDQPNTEGVDDTTATSELPTQPPSEHPTEPLAGSWGGTPPQSPSYNPTSGGPNDRPPRRIRNSAIALVAVTAFVFGAGGVGLGAALVHHDNNNDDVSSNAGLTTGTGSPAALSETPPKSYAGIASKLLPSVVSVNVTGSQESDTGSGIVLRQDGYILTNNHVVAAAANGGSVSATFNNGSSATAKIIGTDSLDDLAVIKVNKTGLKPATLGSDSGVQVGDPVLAVGSPLGLSGTVTSGIVSALNRPVVTSDDSQQQQNPFGGSGGSSAAQNPTVIDAIQTDAAINPGNSGGPLVNSIGQVIGVNSAIASLGQDSLGSSSQSGNIGVGFAIPIDEAKTIATELITTGKAVHPLLGVTLTNSTASDGTAKAVVHSVVSGGPAAKAGLKAGDVITAINGSVTAGDDAVIAAIRSHQPGQQVSVTYQRGGSSHTVSVTLTQQSSQS